MPSLVGGLRRSQQKPLCFGAWNPKVLVSERLRHKWCFSGPFLFLFRKWSGEFSKRRGGLQPQPGRFFENQARLVNIFKVVVVYQMSCVSTTCCQALFVSGNATLWNINWTKTSHSLIDKFLAPKSYGNWDTLCRTVWMQTSQESKRQYGWTESSTFLALPPSRVFHLQRPTCHQNSACFWFTKHLWVRVWSCCLVQIY